MNESFNISENDIVEYYIYCENSNIYNSCLSQLFSKGYYWWGDQSQRIKNCDEYDEYIVCYSGDSSLGIPLNIAVCNGSYVKKGIIIINGMTWLRKLKLDNISNSIILNY